MWWVRTTGNWFGRKAPSRWESKHFAIQSLMIRAYTETELHKVQLILLGRYMLRSLSSSVERHIYIMFIAEYLLPHSVCFTGFFLTMNRSLCNNTCSSKYNLMEHLDFIPFRQNVNTSLITHIYIDKHQFLHVDETQNYRNITVYEFILPEQK